MTCFYGQVDNYSALKRFFHSRCAAFMVHAVAFLLLLSLLFHVYCLLFCSFTFRTLASYNFDTKNHRQLQRIDENINTLTHIHYHIENVCFLYAY